MIYLYFPNFMQEALPVAYDSSILYNYAILNAGFSPGYAMRL